MEKSFTLSPLKGHTLPVIRHILLGMCLLSISFSARAQLTAAFTADHSVGCGQLSVQFTDQSTGNPTIWHWEFNNGTSSTLQNPSANFSTPGTFPVTLTVSDGIHTSAPHTEYITVHQPPTVKFSSDVQSGCYPLGVQFTDQSTPGDGGFDTWTWDFGDGSPFSHEQNPLHIYNSAGTFTPVLTVKNKAGCEANVSGQKIVTNEGVTVDFSADKTFSCTAPLTVNFTATTSSSQTVDYVWDFGDSKSGSGKTVSHTYTSKGNFTVTLTASVGGGGCKDVVTKEDYILVDTYTSDFEIPQGCAGTRLTFKNTSVPRPVSSSWDFGDGATASTINGTHQYQKADTYTVTLTNDFGGCQKSVTKTFTTYPSPTADFSSDKQPVFCGLPANVAFQNTSQGSASWKWRFGDGDSTTTKDPTHNYKAGGKFPVTLIAYSDKGCVDSVVKPDYIQVDAPDLRFGVSDGSGCLPFTTTFSIPAASQTDIASYAWDFGDETAVSTDASPTHTYTKQGNFDVTLEVVTKSACKLSFTRDGYINTGTPATVDFSADPLEVCPKTAVQFTNLSTPPGVAWVWTFSEGVTDTAQNPLHIFSEVGSHDVTLSVNNFGCITTLTKPDYIEVKPPAAKITQSPILQSCSDPYTYQFRGDESKGAQTYSWDFGDGSPLVTDANPIHTFTSAGAKHVFLTVTNGECSSTDDVWVQVTDENPVLTAAASPVCHGDNVKLTVADIDIPEFYRSFAWDDGAGHSRITTTPSTTFSYPANGSYTPSVEITFKNGCKTQVSASPVTVQGPDAGFTTSTQEICQGNVVTFTDNSTPNPVGTALTRWVWDYGDGNADTTSSPSIVHTYTEDGFFNTRLTVTDANGCSDKSEGGSHLLTVNPSKADFSTPDTLVCPGSAVTWLNNSSGGPGTSYLWDFGDGSTPATVQNPPDHYYAKDSVYTVSLKIVTDKGCTDSLVRTDYVRVGHPEALMADSSPVTICRIYLDTAINRSKNYRSILWDFGDGFTSTRDTVYHIYNVPGTYIQRLTVQGYSPGCAATTTRKIVIAGPIGTPEIADTAGCAPFGASFTATGVERAVTYQWFFGNGAVSAVSTSPDASYTYQNAGAFHPTLKLTDDTGCYVIVPIADSLTVVVDSIGAQPVFSYPEVCDSNRINFSTEGSVFSQRQLGETPTYQWDFGDPTTGNDVSTDSATSYRYPGPGNYQAQLILSTRIGCNLALPVTVTVPDSVPLAATATADPTEICAGATIQLHSGANDAVTYQWSPAESLNDPTSPDPVATPAASTTYTVTTTSADKCQNTQAQVAVVVHDNPVIDAGDDLTVSTGSVVQLTPTGSSDIISWKWSPADYLNCTTCESPTSTPRSNMQYTVQVANSFGCISTDSMKLNLVCDEGKVFIPNTFTPNGDGQNDIFYPRGVGVKSVLYFRIYDRYGQLVFESTRFQLNDKTAGWDGTTKGVHLGPGVFVYTTEMVCDNDKVFQLSGNISLVR